MIDLTMGGRTLPSLPTSPIAGLGGGVMMRTGPLTFDVGYRYKKIFAKDFVSMLLGGGESLKSQQVSFGVGVRF